MGKQTEEAAPRMPYEGSETSESAAADQIVGLLDSDEGDPEEPGAEGAEEQDSEAEEVEASAEEDEAEESEEDEESEEAEEESEPSLYEVTLPGGEKAKVTLEELTKGYSRTKDYIQKTEAVANERKAIQAEVEQVREKRDQYATRLELVEEVLTKLQPAEPDWAKLRAENPAEFAALKVEWDERQREIQAVKSERERLEAEKAEEFQRELADRLADEQAKLATALPEWADEQKGPALRKSLEDYAYGLGFSQQEVGLVADHRLILLLDKARRFDALQAKAEPVLKKAKDAPVLKPGARDTSERKGVNVKAKIARDRFRKTGHARDAAALIEHMLDD